MRGGRIEPQVLLRMRDTLIHGYDEVDFEKVWQDATAEVPDLLARLEPLLPPQE